MAALPCLAVLEGLRVVLYSRISHAELLSHECFGRIRVPCSTTFIGAERNAWPIESLPLYHELEQIVIALARGTISDAKYFVDNGYRIYFYLKSLFLLSNDPPLDFT